MKKEHFSPRALFTLLIVPILIAIVTIVLVLLSLLGTFGLNGMNLLVVLVIVLYPALFYFTWLFRKVSYSDTTILDKIDINGAPEEIAEQLKIISRNRLVNLNIILFLGETRRKPNQSEIVKHLTDSGINLTPTRIREIIGDLEKMHLIISVKGIHEREYSLTKKGDWCFAAAQYYFPKRNGLFVLRNQIVQKKFPPFPESDE